MGNLTEGGRSWDSFLQNCQCIPEGKINAPSQSRKIKKKKKSNKRRKKRKKSKSPTDTKNKDDILKSPKSHPIVNKRRALIKLLSKYEVKRIIKFEPSMNTPIIVSNNSPLQLSTVTSGKADEI